MTTTTSRSRQRDGLGLARRRTAHADDASGMRGHGTYVLRGPDGEVLQTGVALLAGEFHNLITDVGDEFYAKRGAGVTVNAVTGMRLGTGGATAVAKNGAGAAIAAYTPGSRKALDSGFPTAATKGAGLGWRVAYKTTWAAGEATATNMNEVVLTNETPLTDIAGTAANTVSRAILSPSVNKGASDTLEVTWNHDLLGQ